jgi:hypothetical protein
MGMGSLSCSRKIIHYSVIELDNWMMGLLDDGKEGLKEG